jgi:hypothetical protein
MEGERRCRLKPDGRRLLAFFLGTLFFLVAFQIFLDLLLQLFLEHVFNLFFDELVDFLFIDHGSSFYLFRHVNRNKTRVPLSFADVSSKVPPDYAGR